MMGDSSGEPADSGVRCAALCFHLPSSSKKKKPPPPVQLGPGKSAQEPDTSASQRVTFLESASLSTWWPSSPSAAAGGAPGNDVVGRRASARASFSFPSSPVSSSSCMSTPKLAHGCQPE